MSEDYRDKLFEEFWGIDATTATNLVFDFIDKRKRYMTDADVEDLAQETLVKALAYCQKSGREPVCNGAAFLRNLADWQMKDFWRGRGAVTRDKRQRLVDEFDATHEKRAAAYAQQINWVDRLRRQRFYIDIVESLIDELKPKPRSIMRLLWDPLELNFEALPHQIVGELLTPAVPRITVYKTYRRCLDAWSRTLDDFKQQLQHRSN